MCIFTVNKENFLNSYLFENPCLTFDAARKPYLRENFFTLDEMTNHGHTIKTLIVRDFLDNGRVIVGKNTFVERKGFQISDLKYNKLVGMVRTACIKYTKLSANEKKTDTVQNFCMRIKKGCKRFRKIIDPQLPTIVAPNIIRYADVTETFINSDQSCRLNGLWGIHTLENSTKTFFFKFLNNLLGTNNRVSHFVDNHSRNCTFCDLLREPYENTESIGHLFFDCRIVENIVAGFYTWIFSTAEQRFVNRREYFGGFELDCTSKNITLDVVGVLFKKFIWDCKTRFNIPSLDDAKTSFIREFNVLLKHNRNIKTHAAKSGFFNNKPEIHF